MKDGFRCGYILAWAPAWVRWWCGLWIWRCGGSQWGESRRARSWQGGSRTHGKGEWVLMGGFRRGLGWIPTLMVFGCWFFAMDFCFLDFGFQCGLGLARIGWFGLVWRGGGGVVVDIKWFSVVGGVNVAQRRWVVTGKLDGGGGWERVKETELEIEVRNIKILFLYYFNVQYGKIKVRMLDVL